MSHGRERKEKDCLNCGTQVEGHFCQHCGQENLEPHETFFSMVNHFFSDITHFDGKFFGTVGTLFRRPGFLSREYVNGRRAKYLHPIRMYVFTSALFFLVFFSFYKFQLGNITDSTRFLTEGDRKAFRDEAFDNAKNAADSAQVARALAIFDGGKKDSTSGTGKPRTHRVSGNINVMETDYSTYGTEQQYDSAQAALPAQKRDGWFERSLVKKGIDLNRRYPGQEGKMTEEIVNKFLHFFPSMLFVSLPLYAFFLYLLYIRRKFFFADHGVFLIHLYVFTFILLLVMFLLMQIHWSWMPWIYAAILIYGVTYSMRAIHNFYNQGWFKTLFKWFLFNLICVISLAFLFAIFFTLSIYQA